ncbi:MAG: class I SAM-dependent methyltransferase [Myxococcales bacterium]|nr:class I SAM-dependent methyltransferase [Myxococcales bacterium]MDD9971115.1 class I SAM-dependent methyltransferase [Myxococcales bacterium]
MLDSLLSLLRCVQADCEARLEVRRAGTTRQDELWHGLLGCRRCEAVYPVLAGVPIMVGEPPHWLSAYRDAALATLAQHGEADRTAVALVQALADAYGRTEPERFDDDWTDNDLETSWPLPPSAATFGGHAFRTFLGEAEKRRPEDLLATWAGAARSGKRRTKPTWVLDLGCGVGVTARALAGVAKRVIVSDQSLRAVMSARRAAQSLDAEVHPLVVDAHHLPLRRKCLDVIVAAQLIDLLDDPRGMLQGAHRSLKQRGALLLSTPAPEILDEDGPLTAWLTMEGFEIERRDTIPWVRAHDARHFQVYFPESLLCRKLREAKA